MVQNHREYNKIVIFFPCFFGLSPKDNPNQKPKVSHPFVILSTKFSFKMVTLGIYAYFLGIYSYHH